MITIMNSGPNVSTTPSQVEQLKITSHNGLLNTTVYPLPGAEAVIMLHGGPGVPYPMREVAEILNRKFQVIYFEQRGTGQSRNSTQSYAIEDYILDIDSIARCFQLNQFHLFGHSWGGLYAQIYAERYPSRIKSLFLCSPSSGTNTTWKRTESEVLHFNRSMTTNMEWIKMGWYSLLGMLGSDKAYRKLFRQVYKNYHKNYRPVPVSDEELDAIYARPVNETRKNIIQYKPLSQFTDPGFEIMVTYGDHDIYGASKKKLIDRFPTATFVEVENAGHIPWLHNPAVFGRLLKTFYQLS